MSEKKFGCVTPVNENESINEQSVPEIKKEEISMLKVGKPAPDFTLSGYYKGEFRSFKLSEFKGKWVLLCFYPGDFTFV